MLCASQHCAGSSTPPAACISARTRMLLQLYFQMLLLQALRLLSPSLAVPGTGEECPAVCLVQSCLCVLIHCRTQQTASLSLCWNAREPQRPRAGRAGNVHQAKVKSTPPHRRQHDGKVSRGH